MLKEIAKQSVEGTAWFFLLTIVKFGRKEIS